MPTGVYKRVKPAYWLGKKRPSIFPSEETRRRMSEAQRGKKLSEEHRKKVSENNAHYWLGRKKSAEVRMKMSRAKRGRKLSIEHKRKIGLTSKGRLHSEESRRRIGEALRGEKSYFWKGGITPVNRLIRSGIEFRLWREAVFARDNWTCQKSKARGGKLHPHHIQNFAEFPELRFALDNGITLSVKAHREFHNKFGRKNNTREQLEEFL